MLVPTLIMAGLALILLAVAWSRGQGQHIEGLRLSLTLLWQILPLIVFALLVAGLTQVLLPREVIARWAGDESGLRGIFLGSFLGALCPGGPFISLPIATALWHAGSGIGTMVAFLTSWSLLAVHRLPMEFGILGWRLTLIRVASTFFFPPLAGLIAHLFFTPKP